MYTVSPRRIPCRICGNYTAEQMVYGTFLTGPRPGFAFDPQDLSTMYQDAAGTLPAYRPGTGLVDPPVGLMLDKSQGLELGPELAANGTFDTDLVGWYVGPNITASVVDGEAQITTGGLITSSASNQLAVNVISPIGRLERFRVSFDATWVSGSSDLQAGIAFGPALTISPAENGGVKKRYEFELSYLVINSSGRKASFGGVAGSVWNIDNVSCREIKGYHAYQSATTARPTLSGRYNLLSATETLATQSVTTVAGIHTLRFEGAGTITLSGTATGTLSAGTHTITCTEGTLTCTVAGSVTEADLRKVTAQTLPEYQAVVDADNYDTDGFPLYLLRDLIDDELIVQSPGFSGQRIAADFDEVTSDAVTIAAGEYEPFGAVDAGPAECTQLLVVAAPSADEITVFERFAAEKGLLPGGV